MHLNNQSFGCECLPGRPRAGRSSCSRKGKRVRAASRSQHPLAALPKGSAAAVRTLVEAGGKVVQRRQAARCQHRGERVEEDEGDDDCVEALLEPLVVKVVEDGSEQVAGVGLAQDLVEGLAGGGKLRLEGVQGVRGANRSGNHTVAANRLELWGGEHVRMAQQVAASCVERAWREGGVRVALRVANT